MIALKKYADAGIAAALGLASFVLLAFRYWLPNEKIFDEIYFARAAEEYLQRRYIYENTHPPVTKLLITLSTMMFGGLPGGDNAYGWRFLDVVAGAVAVMLAYALARRVTGSRIYGVYAAVLFGADGMHFVQSRIATPESFVVCFSLATLYALLRYWDAIAAGIARAASAEDAPLRRVLETAVALVLGVLVVVVRFPHETPPTQVVIAIIAAAIAFAAYRLWRARPQGAGWLVAFGFCAALLVTSKWYGVMTYGVAAVVGSYVALRAWRGGKASPIPLDAFVAVIIATFGIVYALAYIPHFIGLRDLQNLPPRPYTASDVVTMQVNAFLYHDHLRATHPYASSWWQWPLDLRPILYYANYGNIGKIDTAAMIYSLPNPLLLWPGLFTVPLVGWFAWRERNRAYAVVVIAYLLQWLPWMFSPRIAF
ncbi:MAG: phospholipid carrier-dependent glycosyltransferase, partial [bacterium]|nr:phospholipid carrier-dependent glycosyltransferase [bacterium]